MESRQAGRVPREDCSIGKVATAMTTDELIEHYAAAFRARASKRNADKQPKQAGWSGPLGHADLPTELVDEMEAAIEEAFEQIGDEEEQAAEDEHPVG